MLHTWEGYKILSQQGYLVLLRAAMRLTTSFKKNISFNVLKSVTLIDYIFHCQTAGLPWLSRGRPAAQEEAVVKQWHTGPASVASFKV